jgi:uncharacterized protein (TIGR03790 family)
MSLAHRLLLRAALACALSIAAAPGAFAQTGANVAVVINEASEASGEIGRYYAAKRKLPAENVITLRAPTTDTIDRDGYVRNIETPILAALQKHRLQDRVLYLVLTKGIPLMIEGTGGRDGTRASVDSELTLLYRRLTGATVPVRGPVVNPYFQAESGPVPVFTRTDQDIYLVTRLDGFTVADVRDLIDRASAPQASGLFVFDQKTGGASPGGDQWLRQASDALRTVVPPDRVRLAIAEPEAPDPVIGYASWGSNDPGLHTRAPSLKFAPGALAMLFVGTSARTFTEPPKDWVPGADFGADLYAGSRDSLLGDLVRAGATGAAGAGSEPFMDGTVRPDALFPAYVSGRNLAESFYRAIPFLSWQTVVVGDPLCAPFAKAPAPIETSNAIDPETELPVIFAKRRLAALVSVNTGLAPATVSLFVRAMGREARGDFTGAVETTQQVIASAPTFFTAREYLGTLYERAGKKDLAERAYRQLLAVNRDNVIALNNLAYLLTERGALDEALTFADQAYGLAPTNASVLDTLGWLQHLRGNEPEALRLLSDATKLSPRNGEVRLHAAIVAAATGDVGRAKRDLAAALQSAPDLANRPESLALMQKLGVKP